MKRKLVCTLLVSALAFASLSFSGCKKDDGTGGYIEGHKYPKTLKVRLMSRDLYHNNGNTIGKDTIVRYFEEKFNVSFEFIYTPSPGQTEVFEKLNMMTSVGDIPDIIEMSTAYQLSLSLYDQFSDFGTIVNSKEYVNENAERYPVLSRLLNDPDVNTPTFCTTNGDLAMIPRYFGTVDHCFIIRKDWADKYNGGKLPSDYLELEEMLVNFKNAKPGGITQVGLTLPSTFWLQHIYAGFIGSQTWSRDATNNNYSHYLTSEGLKDAYRWLNRLYAAGLLDKALFTNTGEADAIEMMAGGFSGCTMMGLTYAVTNMFNMMREADPSVEFAYVNLDGPAAKMLMYSDDYFEGAAVRSGFEDVPRLYDMIEYILSDEGRHLLTYGIEGVHYDYDAAGTMIVNEQKRRSEGWYGRKHGLSALFSVETLIDGDFYDDYVSMNAFIDSLKEEGARVRNPLAGVVSPVEKTVGSRPYDVAGKYEINFIKGDASLVNAWDSYVREVNAAGLARIVEDINARYGAK